MRFIALSFKFCSDILINFFESVSSNHIDFAYLNLVGSECHHQPFACTKTSAFRNPHSHHCKAILIEIVGHLDVHRLEVRYHVELSGINEKKNFVKMSDHAKFDGFFRQLTLAAFR